ncbi:MAG: Tryptophan synthase alpha chain [Myxococcales bacterium]|nr:Tryptophan synthase alpha chain [Myxococcales bacterium]
MKQRMLLCALLVGCGSGSSGKGGIDGGAGGSAGTGGSGGALGEDGGAGVGAAGGKAGSGGKAGVTGADGGRDAATDRTIHADGAVATGGWGSPCWSQADCDQSQGSGSSLVCVEPGRSLGPGACFMSQSLCANDAQCAAKTPNSICMPVPCSPPPDDGCRPGCMTAGCAPGFACGANNRCTPKPCTSDVVCPVNETCGTGFGCVPKNCTRDDQCSGACVSGSCYDRPGTCMPLPV